MEGCAPTLHRARLDVDPLNDSAAQISLRAFGGKKEVLRRVTLVFVIGVAEHHPATTCFAHPTVAWCAAPT